MQGRISRALAASVVAFFMLVGLAHGSALRWGTAVAAGPPGTNAVAASCAGTQLCGVVFAATNGTGVLDTFSPSAPKRTTAHQLTHLPQAGQLACPSATECVVGDQDASVQIVNPTQSQPAQVLALNPDGGRESIACPSPQECVAVDGSGHEAVFDPTAPQPPAGYADLRFGPSAIACPSPTQCTAVGTETIYTFNPEAPGIAPQQEQQTNVRVLIHIACPSVTQCTATDTDGSEDTFDPTNVASVVSNDLNNGTALADVSCLTTTDCVALGNGGGALEGNPQTGAYWPQDDYNNAVAGLQAISCPTANACVAGASGGSIVLAGALDTTPIPAATPAPGRATIVRVTATSTGLSATVRCAAPARSTCRLRFLLAAGLKRGNAADVRSTLRNGTRVVSVRLVSAAQRLLARYGTLSGHLTISETLGNRTVSLGARTVTLRATRRH